MDFDAIQAHNEKQALALEERGKQEDMAFALKSILDSQGKIEDSVKKNIILLIKFLNQNKPQVSVINQQPFPSYDKVISAIEGVISEVKNSNKSLATVEQKEVDFTGVIKSLDKVASLIEKLPKPIDKVSISNQSDYSKKFDEVTQAVSGIEVSPVVNIAPTEVNLDDIPETLQKLLKSVDKIKFPDIPKTDFSAVEKAVKSVEKSINSLVFPVPNYILPFKDTEGKATQVTLDGGSLPVSGSVDSMAYALRLDDTTTASVVYLGRANPGTADSSAAWEVRKIDETSGEVITYADGNANFDNVWSNRASLTYA